MGRHDSPGEENDIDHQGQRWAGRVTLKAEKDDDPSLYNDDASVQGLEADYVTDLGLHRVQHDYFCFRLNTTE